MSELNVVSVFIGGRGSGGNAVGVVPDAAGLEAGTRQAIAAELGFSETVFVEDADRGAMRIHTPTQELPFAGHPLVGTSWLLREQGAGLETLRPPAGPVPTWVADERTWIRARPEWSPPFELRRLASAAEIEDHGGATSEDELLLVWAWEGGGEGQVRARAFPRAIGVAEDEATGSAAILLTAELGLPLSIRQGRGSEILTRPYPDGTVAVGGRCRLAEARSLPELAP